MEEPPKVEIIDDPKKDIEGTADCWELEKALSLISALDDTSGVSKTWRHLQRCRIAWDLGAVDLVETTSKEILDGAENEKDAEQLARAIFLAVRGLCSCRKYMDAVTVLQKYSDYEGFQSSENAEVFLALARAIMFLVDENLAGAEAVIPGIASVEGLPLLDDRLEALSLRLFLWTEYGFYDKVAAEMKALISLAKTPDIPLRFGHKVHATIIAAALFLRDFDVIKASPLMQEYPMLPSVACHEIARIVLPYWASMVTLSHEYLPFLRNFHYGHMPMIFRGLQLLVGKKDRLVQPRLLLNIARVCTNMFCYDWVFDDQSDRNSFEPYLAYLNGYLELRDELYVIRERMRKVWDVSDSHDDLQGTGWILVGIAGNLAASPTDQARVFLSKCYFRCLWRQGDKCEMLLARQKDPLPTKLMQMEMYFIRAFRFYVNEKWEAFLYHHEQAMNFWDSFGITRANALMRFSRLLPIHRTLSQLLCAYHMHHTLEHHKAVAAIEKHRCMFLDNVPGYNPDRPFDHIPPQTTVVYFIMILHLTEVWTCVKLDHEEYQNQVVPQLWCYNYYRKKAQGPGEGKLTLLNQVKDQAIFAGQQWENSSPKEHVVLSSVHLAIKEQLDSIAGIYKTHARRVLIVPDDSLCNTPWPSMPSSNQKWFLDMINANTIPGLGFFAVNGVEAEGAVTPPPSDSVLVSVRDHKDMFEPDLKYGANELRIASHHLKNPPEQVLVDRKWDDKQKAPTLGNFLEVMLSKPHWRVLHFIGTSNSRRLVFADHEELTVSSIRAMPDFPRVDLLVLAGHKPYRCQTYEGPQGLAKAFMERGVSVVLFSTIPISSKKHLQLMAYLYTLMEQYPNVAVDGLMRLAMQQLRKTTNVFIEWGAFNVMGTIPGKIEQIELQPEWKWPRLFNETSKKPSSAASQKLARKA